MSNHVVILAGGAGTRFWPAGRKARPKQLLAIVSENTLLRDTLERCAPLAEPANNWIVTNELQVEATRKECPSVPTEQVVAEPLMRNTAAAIGLAAFLIRQRDPDAVMVVVPADHAIQPQENFLATFSAAIERAKEVPVLITVGIVPSGPATGYGYIEGGEQVATVRDHPVHTCLNFKEKPDPATASKFVESGRYFWNSGTFVWTVTSLLAALEQHLPGHYSTLNAIAEGAAAGKGIDEEAYAKLEHVPIDIGVMEKADNVEVLPADFVWDDVGS
ncbi:MAG: mannose-1-phosphate guanylyltransferase, partial [Planctomycetota bacterium]